MLLFRVESQKSYKYSSLVVLPASFIVRCLVDQVGLLFYKMKAFLV